MDLHKARELIKERGMWEEFIDWFAEWFDNSTENGKSIIETAVLLYAEGLEEI